MNSPNDKFFVNSTQRPNTPFEVTITPDEVKDKNVPTTKSVFQLTWKNGVVDVLAPNGTLLGQLPATTEEIYGDGIRYIEDRGQTVWCVGDLEIIGDKVFGKLGIRENVSEFFYGKVPQEVLDARVKAEVAAFQEENRRRLEEKYRDADENVAVPTAKKRGLFSRLFRK